MGRFFLGTPLTLIYVLYDNGNSFFTILYVSAKWVSYCRKKPFELDYFRLVPPITVIFSLTERTMQEEPLPNSQYVPYTHGKFFRGFWSQKFTENWQFRVFLDTPREIVFLFQNNVLLWRFFRYLAIGTSYVQDFFTDVKSYT